MSYPRAALLASRMAGRYRRGQHHQHNGFLEHAFATSPWLGAAVVVLIVLAGLVVALLKTARRVLDGTPWSVRLALLVTAGMGIFRLLSRRNRPRRSASSTRQMAGNPPRHRTRPRKPPVRQLTTCAGGPFSTGTGSHTRAAPAPPSPARCRKGVRCWLQITRVRALSLLGTRHPGPQRHQAAGRSRELTPSHEDRVLGVGGPVNGNAAGANPGMVSNKRPISARSHPDATFG
jgi:hypothetical protein